MDEKNQKQQAITEVCIYAKRMRKTDVNIPDFIAVFPNISIAIKELEGHPYEADVEYYVPMDDLAVYENVLKSLNELTLAIEDTALAGAILRYHHLDNLNRFTG